MTIQTAWNFLMVNGQNYTNFDHLTMEIVSCIIRRICKNELSLELQTVRVRAGINANTTGFVGNWVASKSMMGLSKTWPASIIYLLYKYKQ